MRLDAVVEEIERGLRISLRQHDELVEQRAVDRELVREIVEPDAELEALLLDRALVALGDRQREGSLGRPPARGELSCEFVEAVLDRAGRAARVGRRVRGAAAAPRVGEELLGRRVCRLEREVHVARAEQLAHRSQAKLLELGAQHLATHRRKPAGDPGDRGDREAAQRDLEADPHGR